MSLDELDFSRLTSDPNVDEEKLEDVLLKLEDLCTICEAEPTIHDTLGFPWCDEHGYRGEFLDYGAKLDYPALEAEGYAVAAGSWFWTQIVLLGSEDCILALFSEAVGQVKEVA